MDVICWMSTVGQDPDGVIEITILSLECSKCGRHLPLVGFLDT